MKRWEYMWVTIGEFASLPTAQILNERGAQGWEFTGHVEDTGQSMDYLMKRESDQRGSNAPEPESSDAWKKNSQLTQWERQEHGKAADRFPGAQIVYSLTDVEAILRRRMD